MSSSHSPLRKRRKLQFTLSGSGRANHRHFAVTALRRLATYLHTKTPRIWIFGPTFLNDDVSFQAPTSPAVCLLVEEGGQRSMKTNHMMCHVHLVTRTRPDTLGVQDPAERSEGKVSAVVPTATLLESGSCRRTPLGTALSYQDSTSFLSYKQGSERASVITPKATVKEEQTHMSTDTPQSIIIPSYCRGPQKPATTHPRQEEKVV
ncbi:hypothetical protein LZ32DRAFT_339103 [Colletotrichum eremochloae]|nr:hypothetical protein LZ32DRAFT_339103 [Colletotrichum eremochloae]